MSTYIKTIEATTNRDDLFALEDMAQWKTEIFPKEFRQLGRQVRIGRGAQVNAPLYGKEVIINNGFSSQKKDRTRTLSIFGRELVSVGDFCCVGGNITSGGEIRIGKNSVVSKNVIAPNVKLIEKGTKIKGNLISKKSVTIEENVAIGGYVIVLDGELVLKKNCRAFDIISSGKVDINDGVTLSDPVVWSNKGRIEFSSVTVGKPQKIVESNMSDIIIDGEINPYLVECSTCNYQELFEELKKNLTLE